MNTEIRRSRMMMKKKKTTTMNPVRTNGQQSYSQLEMINKAACSSETDSSQSLTAMGRS